ncbi:MAG: glutamate--tRNA ligase [Clostridia bacterium]|nr:glutamate--tRNA ligase [Clostridia bacterium]
MTKVRTRFAPSPTGYMHIGNLRTALYAYLLAKSQGGDFILRIEDTDRERYVDGAVDLIYKTMAETGLVHDEGPDVGGPYGPYVQSERIDIYKKYAEELVEKGHAYYCFCTKERLDELRVKQEALKIPSKYDGRCASLTKEEIAAKIAAGEPYVIRQKIPREGVTTFEDEVFGKISAPNDTLDDNVLLKSDGLPTYNFANVVDDHLMKITHVVRGSEYLSSTPKYNLLYEAFGWEIPKYIHCSAIMKDAHRKLSKREGDASYADFVDKGYLKDAVLNYIALLGWSPGDTQEIMSLNDMIRLFDVKGISKSPAIFDQEKLNWLNGEYIRALDPAAFHEMAMPYYKANITRDVDLTLLSAVLQQRTEKLSDIPEQIDFIDTLPAYEKELYCHKKMKTNLENSLASLKEILPRLQAVTDWTKDTLHDLLIGLAQELEVKNGIILWPLRTALSGKAFTPGGGIELAAILGKEESLARIEKGIALLEG